MQRNLMKSDFYLFEGVNAYREGNRIPPDTLFYAENSRFAGGRWASKRGYTAFGDELTGGTNIKGLMDYERFPSGVKSDYVVSYYNEKFYRHDLSDASQTEIAATGWTTADVNVEGVSYNGKLYVCDGQNADIGVIDDVTFSTVTDSPENVYLLETWAQKIWAVTNDAPATAQYTATASSTVPENAEDWTTVGASGAQLIGKGGKITSMRNLDEKLYVLKKNFIGEFYDIDLSGNNPQPLIRELGKGVGAVNHRACVVVENDIWFLDPNLQIRSLGQESGYFQETRTDDLSYIIQRHKSDLDPDQSGATAWYNNGLYKCALKENGSNQNNLLFVYDRDQGFWSFDKATSPQVACTLDGKAFFGVDGTSGQVYRDENGYSDNGFPMSFAGKTGLRDDGRADLSKYCRYLYIRGARSEDVVITAYLLGEDFERLETHTITAPTALEIAAGAVTIDDGWGQVGDIVGGGGYTGSEPGAPPVYRFNMVFSTSSTDRMFGVEFQSSINAQRIFIDECKVKYIPRGEQYHEITS